MKRHTAEVLSKHLEQSIRSMSEAIGVVTAELPAPEAERLKRAIGVPLGRISLALDAIYDEHPDLTPPGLK